MAVARQFVTGHAIAPATVPAEQAAGADQALAVARHQPPLQRLAGSQQPRDACQHLRHGGEHADGQKQQQAARRVRADALQQHPQRAGRQPTEREVEDDARRRFAGAAWRAGNQRISI